MIKKALRVILVGSTLLFSAACSPAAGQAAAPTPTEQTSRSTAVAQAETLYADLADSYGVMSTIDSGLFATYQGKDRAAWEYIYAEKRKQVAEKLSRIPASGLSPL